MRLDSIFQASSSEALADAMLYRDIFDTTAGNLQATCTDEYVEKMSAAVELLARSLIDGNKVLVFGNGGSAADAQHICGELVGRFRLDRPALPAIALSADPAFLTAWGNDKSFDAIFERQIEAFGKPGDVAWGISTSGDSENVVRAMRAARQRSLHTIGLTGRKGGRLSAHSDVLLSAASEDTPRIQEVHVVTYHAICEAVEEKIQAAWFRKTESGVEPAPKASAVR